ncbi:uncharacterized protein LOC130824611 [Amaranthus tricolor]|uniref:uncharacterized protein LOC130824611 n=1 Tax=Amaranthus tricolor TaxID=29722 RepID=UPI00258435F2|nr:uncharacterized protein LOC130824611 [Amaranthus tricolor]
MDPLAVSWLRVYLSRSHSPHTLVYYRDALDRQRDEQAERIRSVLIQCNDTIQGVATSPADVGYRLCSQTLGSINASLTDALSQAGYEYLIPTPPIIGEVDDTFHTPSPRSSAHRGSSSGGSSTRCTRGRERSSTRGRSSRSPSTSGAMSPFVPPASMTTPPPHPSSPQRIITCQRASQRRALALNVIAEVDKYTPSSSTSAHNKRGRGLQFNKLCINLYDLNFLYHFP